MTDIDCSTFARCHALAVAAMQTAAGTSGDSAAAVLTPRELALLQGCSPRLLASIERACLHLRPTPLGSAKPRRSAGPLQGSRAAYGGAGSIRVSKEKRLRSK